MKRIQKIIKRTVLISLILCLIAGIGHYFIFPHETKSLMVAFSNLKEDEGIYSDESVPQYKIDSLKEMLQEASQRMEAVWGAKISAPKIIFCESTSTFEKYCPNPNAPAVTYLKLEGAIVLSKEALDVDVLTHELSHTELYERIGFFKFINGIPSWFKHGLAMLRDDRAIYAMEALDVQSNIQSLTTDQAFYSGSTEEIIQNYRLAKYEVKQWYTQEKLKQLIEDLNAGISFDTAFN